MQSWRSYVSAGSNTARRVSAEGDDCVGTQACRAPYSTPERPMPAATHSQIASNKKALNRAVLQLVLGRTRLDLLGRWQKGIRPRAHGVGGLGIPGTSRHRVLSPAWACGWMESMDVLRHRGGAGLVDLAYS